MNNPIFAIRQYIERNPMDIGAFRDYMNALWNNYEAGIPIKSDVLWLRKKISEALARTEDGEFAFDFNTVYKDSYKIIAKDDFDSYMVFLEWERQPQDRFYLPRRKIMRKFVDSVQKLIDDELDELFLSMPPRVGKTTFLMFLCTFLIGRNSEKSNLYSAYSDVITSAFYNGCLEVMRDPSTYAWGEVFPGAKIVSTNAQAETMNIDRQKRYPSLTCRSLYGTLNGACDCSGFLISDDLIGGIEEALNKDRLISAWSKVDNNLIPRAKEKAKILWCGTRWSVADPTGLRMDLLRTDQKYASRRYEIINVPALDSSGHSNFDFDYGVGFSAEFYEQRRASFEHNNDMASWLAQYMGEPIERTGVLFEPQEMNYYNGQLPEDGLTRVFMAVDPAYGGGDFTSAPVLYQYEDGRIFVHDVVYSNADKRITQPLIVEAVKRNNVQAMQVEANASTMGYKDGVEKLLKEENLHVNITAKAANTHTAKETRIFDKAPEIRDFYFIESGRRTKEYDQFMQNMFAFKINYKGKQHDDSVDSLAQAVDMIIGNFNRVHVMRRKW